MHITLAWKNMCPINARGKVLTCTPHKVKACLHLIWCNITLRGSAQFSVNPVFFEVRLTSYTNFGHFPEFRVNIEYVCGRADVSHREEVNSEHVTVPSVFRGSYNATGMFFFPNLWIALVCIVALSHMLFRENNNKRHNGPESSFKIQSVFMLWALTEVDR